MFKKSLFLVILAALGCVSVYAQEKSHTGEEFKSNHIELRIGWMHSRMIDDGYSRNLLFKGTNTKLHLAYQRETSHSDFLFSIEGSSGKLKSKNSDLPSNYYTLQPSVDYLRKVGDHNFLLKPGRLYVGAGLNSTNYFVINEAIFDNARLLSLHGLYLDVRERMQFDEKQSLQLTFRLPAAVYVNSLLWNGGASNLSHRDQEHWLRTLTTNGSFRYFDVLRNIDFAADYTKTIGKRTDFVVGYRFRYFSDRDPVATNIYSNELSLGLKIRL
jgi:hypothetical protein